MTYRSPRAEAVSDSLVCQGPDRDTALRSWGWGRGANIGWALQVLSREYSCHDHASRFNQSYLYHVYASHTDERFLLRPALLWLMQALFASKFRWARDPCSLGIKDVSNEWQGLQRVSFFSVIHNGNPVLAPFCSWPSHRHRQIS